VLVVLDLARHSASAPAALQERWQLHLDEAPTISGPSASVTRSATPPQRVDVDVLLPADATLSVTPPEGNNDTYPGVVYTHRLMVDTSSDPVDQRFFVVVQATDSGNATTATSLLSGTGLLGAMIGNDIVLLPADPVTADGGDATSFTVTAATTEAVRVFAAGLQPNQTFTVVASQNGPDLNLSATFGDHIVTDGGGVLAFLVDASRTVTALYSSPIFSDGFESGGVGEWSNSAP